MSVGLKYRRVLLKVSGEALMGARDYGLEPGMLARIADEIESVHALGVELCLVIGGGNIFRGVSGSAVGDLDAGDLRTLHSPPRAAPSRKKARRDLRGRHRQPVLHDRYRRRAPGFRDGLRRTPEGDQGRWRLRCRP